MKNTNHFKITTRKVGAGHFEVSVFNNKKWEEEGSFYSIGSGLVDDISVLNSGFEKELVKHETFEEVVEDCLKQLS